MTEDLFDSVINPADLGLKVGIAGWTSPALARPGAFYPRGLKSAAGRLEFYARNFNLVEVDSSFYRIPPRRHAELWAERTPPGFTFNVKAFGLFTHHTVEAQVLPADLAAPLGLDLSPGSRISAKDLPAEVMSELWTRYREAVAPLAASGRLGLILFQFPKWFPRGRTNLAYLASLQERLPGHRIAVEFRQHSWLDEGAEKETLAFLRQEGLTYVTVDEPQGYASSVPLLPAATTDTAFLRLHGRNTDNWDRRGAGLEERFRYDYPREELAAFVPVLRRLQAEAREVHVVFNNCVNDNAVRNARQLLGLFAGKEVAGFGD